MPSIDKDRLYEMKYRDYTARDFANDSFFIRWVRKPDEESDWFWSCFIKEHPASAAAIEEARQLISSMYFPKHELDEPALESMRNNLLMALRAEREEKKEKLNLSEENWQWRWIRVAAVLILIPLMSWGAYVLSREGASGLFTMKKKKKDRTENIMNAIDEKTVVFLDDGTKVWLNASSKLTYGKYFDKKETRDVYLDGEAFFDVAHNPGKPFIVHTSSIKIKVLGTSFNVKSYPGQKTIETTLVEGKVRIEQTDVQGNRIGDVELKPNQLAVFNKNSKVIAIKEVQPAAVSPWKEEKMVFDEAPVDHVLLQMEKWYNVNIHVEGRGDLHCKLTASIQNERLEDVLKLIEASHNVRYRIDGGDVFIEGTLCDDTP